VPYVIRDRMTGAALTSTTDGVRARALCAGFEQYSARDDLGARNYYWHIGRLPLGARHPYDETAHAMLAAERDALTRAYRARRAQP
jgi:hypothetical protein